ncbi:MAG TPA: 4-(cytidine 5'-diphospho)-2-C-methyl-D-erythritol kinase [Pyrinomonadaceae bacterium]|nr:4-(cytidine 5'-diphospho)-2-C-methyl-D-erythritol kinase [Pyrinomonadaceae bacterium]
MSEPLTVPSFAKINLALRIVGKRKDGYHELCTVFQTVSLADRITMESADELLLECDDPKIPTGPGNLILKAAEALRERYGVTRGARIRLEKHIPSPGGLGGGSSNAAVALMGMRVLWDIPATVHDLQPIAAELGSDVPFFLYGGTALGTGRGTEIEQLPDIDAKHLVLTVPDAVVSTAEAFAGLHLPPLTTEEVNRILLNYRFGTGESTQIGIRVENDFENSVFLAHPSIARAKQMLLSLGASQAGLSGSGASVFGIFDNKETRQTALKALGNESNWRSFAVATVSRAEYRGALSQVL